MSATTAELVNGEPLLITAEITVPVEFTLFARPGTTLHDVKRVATHSHALAQCRGWLAENLPNTESYVVSSTAAAAQSVSDPASPLTRRSARGSRESGTGWCLWRKGSGTAPTPLPGSSTSAGRGRCPRLHRG